MKSSEMHDILHSSLEDGNGDVIIVKDGKIYKPVDVSWFVDYNKNKRVFIIEIDDETLGSNDYE